MTIWTPTREVDTSDVPSEPLEGRRARTVRSGEGWDSTRTGLYVPAGSYGRARYGPRPIAIDLFCGAGGATCGLFQGGFRVIAGMDFDPTAALTYMWNNGAYPCQFVWIEPGDAARMEKALNGGKKKTREGLGSTFRSGSAWISNTEFNPGVEFFFLGDARKISGAEVLAHLGLERGDVDLIFGGPPCQGYSTGGKRNVMDPRNSLVFEFARLVVEIQPKTMVFENVPGIVSMTTPEGLPVLDALCSILSDGGMGTYEALKKSLAGTSGLGALVKTTRESRRDADGKEAPPLKVNARGKLPAREQPRGATVGQLALELSA